MPSLLAELIAFCSFGRRAAGYVRAAESNATQRFVLIIAT